MLNRTSSGSAQARTRTMGGGCLFVFGIPFLVAGLVITFFQVRTVWQSFAVQGWEEIPCQIESASLRTDDSTYEAKAEYSYRFQGRSYHSNKVTVVSGSDNLGSFQRDAARELSSYQKSGQPFRCYVDPVRPEHAVLYKTARVGLPAFLLIFALTFPAAGAGVMAAGLSGMRSAERSASLKALNPEQPWRWNAAWTGSVIPAEGVGIAAAWAIYACWSGLLIWPVILLFLKSGELRHLSLGWLVLLFPLLWLMMLAGLLKFVRKRFSYGRVGFAPSPLPGSPGGGLRGALVFGKPLPQPAELVVTLKCERQVTTSSGDSSTTTKEELWSQQQRVPTMMATSGPEGTRLAVGFSIPSDAPETDIDAGDTKHVWTLRARVPGTPLDVSMEVPVFRTDDSTDSAPSTGLASVQESYRESTEAELPKRLEDSGLGLKLDGRGHPLSLDPAIGRPKGMIAFLIFFDIIWSAAFVFMLLNEAPIFFTVLWGISSSAIWVGILWMALHRRSLHVEADGIRICHALGPFKHWDVYLRRAEIDKFTHDSNMTSGSTSYYRVAAKLHSGKSVTLADGIAGAVVAEVLRMRFDAWLA